MGGRTGGGCRRTGRLRSRSGLGVGGWMALGYHCYINCTLRQWMGQTER